jgi:hypothetical protein
MSSHIPPPHVNSFVLGPAVINTHTHTHTVTSSGGVRPRLAFGVTATIVPPLVDGRGGRGAHADPLNG